MTLDALDRPVTSMDALGYVTTVAYDALGHIVRRENALGHVWTSLYDGIGNPKADTNPLGQTTTYLYDQYGRLHVRQDPLGYLTTSLYDLFGRPSGVQNARGAIYTTLYDFYSRPVAEQDALGNVTTTVYDAYGRVWATEDPLGNRRSLAYDALWRVEARQGPSGAVTTTLYDSVGRVGGIRDALGRITTFVYDQNGRLSEQTDPLGYKTTYSYDVLGNRTEQWNALNYRTTWSYNCLSQLRTQEDALGRISTYSYSPRREPVRYEDPLGNARTLIYDRAGQLIAREDPLGYRTTTVYDRAGRAVARWDALGYRTTTLYDANGWVQGRQNQEGAITTFLLDTVGNLTTRITPLGFRWTATYDLLDRQTTAQAPLGYLTTYLYDRASRRVGVVNAVGGLTTTVYDTSSRIQALQDPLGYRTTFGYDLVGNQITMRDALGAVWTTQYDALDRPLTRIDPLGYRTTGTYDPVGQFIQRMQPTSGSTLFGWDAAGQPQFREDPLGNRTAWEWDAAGRLAARQDGQGQRTTYTVDTRGFLTGIRYADGTRVTQSFDAIGQQRQMVDTTGLTTYSYDSVGRLLSVTNPGLAPLAYAYDRDGNRVRRTAPNGGVTTYNYDAQGRVSTLRNPWGETTTLAYDGLNRETLRRLANGTVVSQAFDGGGRRTGLQVLAPAGGALARYTVTYDAVGNPKTALELDGTQSSFSYDAAYRLILEGRSGPSAYAASYTYDGNGNRRTRTEDGVVINYDYNRADQLLGWSIPGTVEPRGPNWITLEAYPFLYQHPVWRGERLVTGASQGGYTWDKNGNLLTEVTLTGRTTYAWDGENRLRSLVLPTGARETYTYAADGLRRTRTTSGGVTRFVWDGPDLLQELDAGGSLTAGYTHAPGEPGGVVSQRRGATSLYHGFDPQGNVRLLTGSAGTAVDQYSYHAFGDGETGTGSDPNPFQYGGEVGYYQDGTDRLYVRARHYRPDLGAWLSADPVASEPRYQYVYNNPTGFTDPTGTATSVIGAGAAPAAPGPGIVQAPSVPLPPPPLAPPVIGARFPDWGYNPGVTYGSSSPNLSGASLLAAPDVGLPPSHPLNLAYPGVRSPADSWWNQASSGVIAAPVPNSPSTGLPPPSSSVLSAVPATECGIPDFCQGLVSGLVSDAAKLGLTSGPASALLMPGNIFFFTNVVRLILPQAFAAQNHNESLRQPAGMQPISADQARLLLNNHAAFNQGLLQGFFTEGCETFNPANWLLILSDFLECAWMLFLDKLRNPWLPEGVLLALRASNTLSQLWNTWQNHQRELQAARAKNPETNQQQELREAQEAGVIAGSILFHVALALLLVLVTRGAGAGAAVGVAAARVGRALQVAGKAAHLAQEARAFSAAHQPGNPCAGPLVGALTLAAGHAAGKALGRGVAAGQEVFAARAGAKQVEVAEKLIKPAETTIEVTNDPPSQVGTYTTKIDWGIHSGIDVRPDGPGFWGKRVPQPDPRVEAFELKINPNNESYYLPHPQGGYVQFENFVESAVQDGKLVLSMKGTSMYRVAELPPFAAQKVLAQATRQVEAASAYGLRVEWLVSDQQAVSQLRSLFSGRNLDVTVIYFPE